MLNGQDEAWAIVAAMRCPELVSLTVHPRSGAPTYFQLRSHTGRVLVSSTTHHDIVGCLATMHQTQK
jgi:hypothetical protein